MSDEAKRWMDAGARLAGDPAARVLCPVCQDAHLAVSDILGARAFERRMVCPKCGAKNWVVLSSPRKR